jgi:hypothetical protein
MKATDLGGVALRASRKNQAAVARVHKAGLSRRGCHGEAVTAGLARGWAADRLPASIRGHRARTQNTATIIVAQIPHKPQSMVTLFGSMQERRVL